MLQPTIDLQARGTRHGHVPLIHSDHRHAHSVIPIPISVIRGGPGPTVLVTAGVHGDEFAGILAARQAIAELSERELRGRVIVLPQLNLPACRAGTRVSPLDGGNLNRVFPGGAQDGPTAQIAAYLETDLLTEVDFAVDLHSGGTTARYVPSAFLYRQEGTDMRAKRDAALAFGLPVALVVEAGPDSGSLLGACDRQGVPAIACEVSGGSTLDRHAIARSRAGLFRVLDHWGVLRPRPDDVPPATETTFVAFAFGPPGAVIAPLSGGIVPLCDPGDTVRAGQTAALLYSMEDMGAAPRPLAFPQDGIVVSVTARADVCQGDMICMTGQPESVAAERAHALR